MRVAQLLLPALLGFLLAWSGRPKKPEVAIGGLNVFALYVAFPALVVRGLMDVSVKMPDNVAFYLLWPVVLSVALVGLAWFRRKVDRQQAGVLALALAFGNVAYLGLPYIVALAGDSVRGAATLAVSIHVVGAVTVGPFFYMRWASTSGQSMIESLKRLLVQPLFWAPWLGLGLRFVRPQVRQGVDGVLAPFAQSAAVVALFMLGLYLYDQRSYFTAVSVTLVRSVVIRLVLMPSLVLLTVWAMVALGWMSSIEGRVHVMLGAMPVAITTFAIASEVGQGQERVAGLIVWSTGLALVSLPLWWWLSGVIL